ncbi:polyprenyl synthetase family protein [Amycolatopsis sp. NPDC004378]
MAVTAEGVVSSDKEPGEWLSTLNRRCLTYASQFVDDRGEEHFSGRSEGALARQVLPEFVRGGKFLRPTSAYAGWCCRGGKKNAAAVRAATSLELLRCFALAQDDVTDASALRRGRPSLHARFAQSHRDRDWTGPPDRFGESAATRRRWLDRQVGPARQEFPGTNSVPPLDNINLLDRCEGDASRWAEKECRLGRGTPRLRRHDDRHRRSGQADGR